MAKELVSVLVPLYNDAKYVLKTLECICSQTYENLEIVICDDGSTDGSCELVEGISDKRIILLKNEKNEGIAYTRNRLFDYAHGEYLAIWDADDLCPIDRIEKETEAAKIHGADVVTGYYQCIDEDDKSFGEIAYTRSNPGYIRAGLLFGNMIANSTALVRREFVNAHAIRYKKRMIGDYLFWVECSLNNARFYTVPEVMLLYRIHSQSITQVSNDKNVAQRNQIVAEIQKTAFSGTGFQLSDQEYDCLFKNFCEHPGTVDSKEELEELYYVLKKICDQSVELGLPNTKEIHDYCRNRFAARINLAKFLWGM